MSGWCGVHYVHHINPSRAELKKLNNKTRLPILYVISSRLKKASGAIKLQFLYNNYMFLQSVALPFYFPQNVLSKCLPEALVENRINLEDEAVLR